MAKSRKGKKPNKMKALRRELDKVVLYSAHCFDQMQIIGITSPSIHLAIFNQIHKWQIALIVFCNDGKEIWEKVHYPDIKPCTAKELQDQCDPITAGMIDKLNPKHFVSSGWYVILTDKYDLKSGEQEMIKMFEDAGAYDRVICNLAWNQRPENEK